MTAHDLLIFVALALSVVPAVTRSWKAFFIATALFAVVQASQITYMRYLEGIPGFKGGPSYLFFVAIAMSPIFLFVLCIALRLAIMAIGIFSPQSKNEHPNVGT
jgi:hypothetical protein